MASAKYGDYTTGVIDIKRQAGITPWRVTIRTNEATQNAGINKGFSLPNGWGAINIGLDYLFGKDDPRNSSRISNAPISVCSGATSMPDRHVSKNTLSIDGSSTLDKTDLDPELGSQRMARMENRRISISNRSSWTLQKELVLRFPDSGIV